LSRLGERVAETVGGLGGEVAHSANEDQAAAAEERKRPARRDQSVGRQLVRVEDLAIARRGRIVGEDGPGQAFDQLVEQEKLRPVQEEERRDTPPRRVAEEGGDLQLRTLRRPS
jgi:hypothetical protein